MTTADLIVLIASVAAFFAVASPDGPGSDPPTAFDIVCGDEAEGEISGRWWLWTDLNCRPNDYESFALTN